MFHLLSRILLASLAAVDKSLWGIAYLVLFGALSFGNAARKKGCKGALVGLRADALESGAIVAIAFAIMFAVQTYLVTRAVYTEAANQSSPPILRAALPRPVFEPKTSRL